MACFGPEWPDMPDMVAGRRPDSTQSLATGRMAGSCTHHALAPPTFAPARCCRVLPRGRQILLRSQIRLTCRCACGCGARVRATVQVVPQQCPGAAVDRRRLDLLVYLATLQNFARRHRRVIGFEDKICAVAKSRKIGHRNINIS